MSDLGNKEVMAKNIRKFMDAEGYTRNDLCELIGVPYSTLADWLHARAYPRIDKIQKMANLFRVSKSELVEANAIPERSAVMNVVGNIFAGYNGIVQEEQTGEKFAIPYDWMRGHSPSEYLLLKIQGDSMFPMINNGDYCLILKQSVMDYSGQIGAVVYDDECVTLKRVIYTPQWIDLEPINSREYKTIRIEKDDLEHCHVIGTLAKLIRSFT